MHDHRKWVVIVRPELFCLDLRSMRHGHSVELGPDRLPVAAPSAVGR
jgi:hypothetical protein